MGGNKIMLSCNGCIKRNTWACERCIGWNKYESNSLVNPSLAISIDKEMKLLAKAALNNVFGAKNAEREINMKIKKVYFNDPVTVVLWEDGTKTIVKAGDGDIYDPEKGLAMAISKKALGNQGNYYEVFKKWLPEECERTTETIKSELTINGNGDLKLSVETKVEKPVNDISLKEYCIMNNLTKNKVYGMIKRNEVDAYKDDKGYWRIRIAK